MPDRHLLERIRRCLEPASWRPVVVEFARELTTAHAEQAGRGASDTGAPLEVLRRFKGGDRTARRS